MKVGIYTLGCKVNSYESEYVANLFKEAGYTLCDYNDICDVYVINTCTVTNQSDSKSRKIIREAIRRNSDACIVAMGCFVEANKDNIGIDGIDILIGNKDKSKIVSLVEKYFSTKKEIVNLYSDLGSTFESMEISNFEGKTRAFVKIQDGCENFCSYCIIPYVRGKCRSKDMELVISEVKRLVNNGFKEIVLTGIHTGHYGVDLDTDFATLLSNLVKIEGLFRLRISSIEITELNDRVLDVIKNSNVICDHLHIPLQAGSDKILKLMNRKYDKDYYRNKIKEIRSIRPNISISTDIIVGFPGEDHELFLETIDFSREIGFSKIHVFPYSERKNTPAVKYPGVVDIRERKERAKRLIEVSRELEIEYMKKFIGSEVSVLIENTKDNYTYGHTSNFLYVRLNGKYNSEDIVNVLITDIDYPVLIGK